MGMKTKRRRKARMGRPPMGDAAKKLALAFRLTPIERRAWEREAKAAGMSLGAYLLKPRRDELARQAKGGE